MKYLKGTLAAFLIVTIFSVIQAKAGSMTFNNIQIPSLKVSYTSGQVSKDTTNAQSIMKRTCKDNLSGDNRAVEAQVHNMFGGDNYSNWLSIPYSWASWSEEKTRNISEYKLNIRASSKLLSSASFWGSWALN